MRCGRFKSIFVKTMAGVSVICFIAITGLWVRSYWVADHIGRYDSDGGGCGISSVVGKIRLSMYRTGFNTREHFFYNQVDRDGVWELEGPPFFAEFNSDGWYVWVPYWFAVTLLGVTSIFLIRNSRRLRYAIGHCPNCGYDLRATPERCPECGLAVSSVVDVIRNPTEPRTK